MKNKTEEETEKIAGDSPAPTPAVAPVPTEAEAREILARFCASHFHLHGREHARASIPADPRRDDDLRLSAFIDHAAAVAKACAEKDAEIARLNEQNRALRAITENDSWSGEMQDALDSIPRQFQFSDYWVNGIKRMAASHAALERELAKSKELLREVSISQRTGLDHRAALSLELGQKERELAQAREDSARLDWLQNAGGNVTFLDADEAPSVFSVSGYGGNNEVFNWPLRAAIDAARAANGGGI